MTINEYNVGSEEIKLRATDTDRNYDATIPFFFGTSQEVAGEHATDLGIGIKEMSKRDGMTWIIVRSKMEFKRSPKWRETLKFETYPQRGYKLFCPRVIRAVDENGIEVMRNMTHWVVMDIERKRPMQPKIVEAKMTIPPEEMFLNPDIGKLEKYADQEKIEEYEKKSFTPSYFDIDYNRHVNNVVYVTWMCESIPDEILMNYVIESVDVSWESQTFEGEEVETETAMTAKDDISIHLAHRITRKSDGKIVFEGNSVWKKN